MGMVLLACLWMGRLSRTEHKGWHDLEAHNCDVVFWRIFTLARIFREHTPQSQNSSPSISKILEVILVDQGEKDLLGTHFKLSLESRVSASCRESQLLPPPPSALHHAHFYIHKTRTKICSER
jgi:hypothetical protein